jgi:peptidoglycan/xylan/chitin deacetylase (PgdA/CDA1 family)
VISFDSALDILCGRSSPVSRAVVINFDDGYRDNWENAFPILKKYNIPATIFLTTGVIGTENRIWLNKLYSDFHRTRVPFINLVNDQGEKHTYSLGTNSDKKQALFAARDVLKNSSGAFRNHLLRDLTSQLKQNVNGDDTGELRMLSWNQVIEMARHNITFGAHTVNHLIMENETESIQEKEIRLSKNTIEERTGRTVNVFAYPGNSGKGFNRSTKDLIKACGYTACCLFSTGTGFNEVGCDPFELNRAEVLRSSFYLHLELLGVRRMLK